MVADAFAAARRTNLSPRELAMLPADYDADRLPAPDRTAVELKVDGIPLLWTARWGRTREGVDFTATSHLWPELAEIEAALGRPHLLHGEYISAGGFEATLSDFRSGKGSGALILFDAVPVDVWEGRATSAPLWERRAALVEAKARVEKRGVGLIRQAVGFDAEGVEIAAGEFWRDELEGLVVKDLNSPYVRARSSAWMRLKRVQTADVRIVSVELREGTALLSAVVGEYEGRTVRVGVGFSEAQRGRPGDFRPGGMIEVRHLGRTGKGALRSPTFARIRGDKA